MNEAEEFQSQLQADPQAHAYCLAACVLQGLANLAASVALKPKNRARVTLVVIETVNGMQMVLHPADRLTWRKHIERAAQQLKALAAPPEIQALLDGYADNLGLALQVGPR